MKTVAAVALVAAVGFGAYYVMTRQQTAAPSGAGGLLGGGSSSSSKESDADRRRRLALNITGGVLSGVGTALQGWER